MWYKRHYLVPLHGVSTAVLPLLKFQPSYITGLLTIVRHKVVLHLYSACSDRLLLVQCVVLDWCNRFRHVRKDQSECARRFTWAFPFELNYIEALHCALVCRELPFMERSHTPSGDPLNLYKHFLRHYQYEAPRSFYVFWFSTIVLNSLTISSISLFFVIV
jgi:hypothetical protein